MKKFNIYASWSYSGWVEVEAENSDEAWQISDGLDICDFELNKELDDFEIYEVEENRDN